MTVNPLKTAARLLAVAALLLVPLQINLSNAVPLLGCAAGPRRASRAAQTHLAPAGFGRGPLATPPARARVGPAPALPQRSLAGVEVIADKLSYNVGEEVRLRVVPASSGQSAAAPLAFFATLRYAGDSRPVVQRVALPASTNGRPEASGAYAEFWKVPEDARTGRYEIDVEAKDSNSGATAFSRSRAAGFAVHRQLVRIKGIQLDKTFYTSGDPLGGVVALKNLTDRRLDGLRVEFSDRYWPWIAPSSEPTRVNAVPVAEALSLSPGAEQQLELPRAAVAPTVKQPTVRQYAVVVWDSIRSHVLAIAFSPIVFVHPPGVYSPRPYAGPPGYPMQYLHPDLDSINTANYRHFYPPALDSPAIQFDSSHTLFASGSESTVRFSVRNPSERPWRGVSIRARLWTSGNVEVAESRVAERVDLPAHSPLIPEQTKFTFPADLSGLLRAQVEITDARGEVLAEKRLDLGINPLPRSILIFCAHEDDEGAHYGVIRAAVENHIPIHFVYFTSGDAGSCDRYYERFCGPVEALNFGAIRMDETRAALGHLGVPSEDIFFLGLPDGGSGEIWSNHIHASDPYLSVILAVDHAPYDGLAYPNLPYARDAVVAAAKEFIKKFQPAVIYTGHPDERHVDHRTNNWFVVKAMQELLREGSISSGTVLLTDQVYGAGPQKHAPYRYSKNVFYVSGEAMALAQEAAWFYQSQDGNHAEGNLRTFEKLPREQVHWQIIDWRDHEGWNE